MGMDLPPDWSDQLQAVYPKRSGPCGWKGTKLLFAVRRALFDASWTELIEGVKRYADFCRTSGNEGTQFVKSPITFIEDGSWAETYEFKPPESREQKERRELSEREAERWRKAKAIGIGRSPPIHPMRGESVAAFETRLAISADLPDPRVRSQIANLAERLKV